MDRSPTMATNEAARQSPVLGLALAALGVVFGDIGTSPLYAVRECFVGPHAVAITQQNVLGVLSLVFWSLTVVISIKYLIFVMRADNEGEGGILALLALVIPKEGTASLPRSLLVFCGLFGAALLYGDGIITPAISVLSAVEGLNVATHAFEPYVVPIAAGILLALFAVQRHGTAGLGAVFGPTMLIWFVVIGVLGLRAILLQPHADVWIWHALNPWHAIEFFARNGVHGFLVLGSVVLCITGGEALYADMGHFGRRPIRLGWYVLVFPALLLNYFGQGALLLAKGSAVSHPFFELAPPWLLYPLVGLATAATIIASQALISGAFSLTHQASQLGYLPRFNIIHTSEEQAGQIYIPQVNVALGALCLLLVLGFQSSSALAGAYGLAVTGTMTATTLLFYAVTRELWSWRLASALAAAALFLLFDLSFLLANLAKLPHGGWFALAVGVVVFTVLTTWKRGRAEVAALLERASLSEEAFLADVQNQRLVRVDGTAVVMTSTPRGIPAVLLHYVKHTRTLHKRVVLLSILTEKRPEVPDKEKVEVKELGQGFYRIIAHFGFMEMPRIRHVLRLCQAKGLAFDLMTTTFFLGRETLLPTGRARMAKWRKRLYILLARNAPSAAAFFEIPVNRVVELGAQLEL
ncbi:MAG: potassium transporter Kup [Candidatus Binatia bacterium]|nr:potassium transporter Kup [Candidatus Binatia bacterium]